MSMSIAAKRSIVARWKQALFLGNEAVWLKATVARDVYGAHQTKEVANVWLSDHLGVTHGSTKGQLHKMSVAITTVPDEDVWIAVGWTGELSVSRLITMTNSLRKKTIAAIRKEAKGGKLPAKAKARVLPVPTRKPAAAPTKTPYPYAALLEAFVADMVKLATFNAGTLALLSPPVLKAVQARMAAKRRKTA